MPGSRARASTKRSGIARREGFCFDQVLSALVPGAAILERWLRLSRQYIWKDARMEGALLPIGRRSQLWRRRRMAKPGFDVRLDLASLTFLALL